MKLKICGLKYENNLREVLDLNPDFVGLIFYPPSPRYIEGSLDPGFVRGIKNTKKVGVFVNASLEEMLQKRDAYMLDGIQLHGTESPGVASALRDEGLTVIKAFSVGERLDAGTLEPYYPAVDYFLFDTRGKNPGGNGQAFNWNLLQAYQGQTPFFLSGGIGPGHISEISSLHHPALYGVDVNSRFETMPGYKNVNVLTSFMQSLERT